MSRNGVDSGNDRMPSPNFEDDSKLKRPSLAEAAAIALWGRHAILLVGGRTAHPAGRLAETMAAALPDLKPNEKAESDRAWRRAGTDPDRRPRPPAVRAEPGDAIFAEAGEPVGAAELAHRGVLAAEDIQNWEERQLAELVVAAVAGRARSSINDSTLACECRVTASAIECACTEQGGRCTCTPEDIRKARAALWGPSAWHLFDIAIRGDEVDRRIDVDELQETFERARLFARSTRDQHEPNARCTPRPGAEGWMLTRAAGARLGATVTTGGESERALRLARSAADVDESRRIDEKHIERAEALSEERRRHKKE